MRVRYCLIQNCVNFRGSKDDKIKFFWPPSDQKVSEKWFEEIGKHQVVPRLSNICILHFEPTLITNSGGRYGLIKGAVPTIFPKSELMKCESEVFEPEVTLKEEPISDENGSNNLNATGIRLIDIGQIIQNSSGVELEKATNVTRTTITKNDSFCHGCINLDVQVQGLLAKVDKLKEQIAESNKLVKYWKNIAIKRGHTEPLDHKTTPGPPPKLRRIDNLVASGCNAKVSLELEPQPKHEPELESNTVARKTETIKFPLKLFKCAKCDADFELPSDLRKHINEVCKKKIFECFVCKKVVSSEHFLQKHLRIHETYKVCSVCSKSIRSSDIDNNHRCDQVQNIQCEYCTETFASTKTLLKHLKDKHKNRKKYKCSKCSRCFGMDILKKIHDCHPNPRNRPFICDLCSKSYLTKSALKQHVESCTSQVIDKGSSENITSIKRHLCEECGKAFRFKENLIGHMLTHKEPSFKCPDCPKWFRTKNNVKRHSSVHKDLKYACSLCDYESSSPSALRKHMNRYHLGKKPIFNAQCQICSRLFTDKSNFSQHIKNHAIEGRAFCCEYCPQTYKYKSDLMKHLKTHLGEEVYQCEECPKRFKFQIELKKHSYEHYKEQQMNIENK